MSHFPLPFVFLTNRDVIKTHGHYYCLMLTSRVWLAISPVSLSLSNATVACQISMDVTASESIKFVPNNKN